MEATRQLKDKIFQRDGYKCAYCLEIYEPRLLHIDHIKPRAKGGTNEPTNLITACSGCNFEKHDKLLESPPIPKDIEIEEGDYSFTTTFSYPLRSFTCSDEVWEDLKTAKLKSGKTWNNFIKQLLNDKNSIKPAR